MEEDSRKNENILAYILIAFCVYRVVHYSLYLINFKWGVVFWLMSIFPITKTEVTTAIKSNFHFWWLAPVFIISLVSYTLWRVKRENLS